MKLAVVGGLSILCLFCVLGHRSRQGLQDRQDHNLVWVVLIPSEALACAIGLSIWGCSCYFRYQVLRCTAILKAFCIPLGRWIDCVMDVCGFLYGTS